MFASPYRFYATENNVGSMVTGSRCSGLVRSIANVHFEQIRKIYPPLKGTDVLSLFFAHRILSQRVRKPFRFREDIRLHSSKIAGVRRQQPRRHGVHCPRSQQHRVRVVKQTCYFAKTNSIREIVLACS